MRKVYITFCFMHFVKVFLSLIYPVFGFPFCGSFEFQYVQLMFFMCKIRM
ncbi:hypothetical protein Hanom_Chr11g00983321 [Helianthus anomalus]